MTNYASLESSNGLLLESAKNYATNYEFIIPISLDSNVVDLRYFKL